MATLTKLFIPNGQKFYNLFDEVGQNLVLMSKEFYEAICKTGTASFEEHVTRLDELEKETDTLAQRLFAELGKNLILPFDREDIYYLVTGLDDVADLHYGVVRQMKSYGILSTGSTSQYIAAEVKNYTSILFKVLKGLRDKRSLQRLQEPCLAMKKIVFKCDSRIDSAISGLFPEYADAIQIIKWMEHFEMLRALVQKCENAVNTIETIIVKYE